MLLYRLAGYPARYVTGYIAQPEEFEADGNGTYTAEVPGKNAHAWAEIYQGDGTGWVPVEMTPGYTEEEEVPVSPEEQEPSAAPSPTEVPEQEEEQGGADGPEQVKVSPGKLPPALIGVLAGTGAVLLLILTVILRRNLVIHMRLRKFKNKNRRRAVLSIVREADRMLFAAGFRTEGELSDREYAGKVQEAFRAWNGNSSCGSWNWGRGQPTAGSIYLQEPPRNVCGFTENWNRNSAGTGDASGNSAGVS